MNILLLIAHPKEVEGYSFDFSSDEDTVKTIFTGVGLVNAATSSMNELLSSYLTGTDYDLIINAGTCGSHKHPIGSILHPTRFYLGDAFLTASFSYKDCSSISFPKKEQMTAGHACLSQNTFTSFPGGVVPASMQPFDCFDMEAFAIASSLRFVHVRNFDCIKIVSDNLDKPLEDWESSIAPLRSPLAEEIATSIRTLIPSYNYTQCL